MAEGDAFDGFRTSRSALVDITNRLGKRGLAKRDECEGKNHDLDEKERAKRIRLPSSPCAEINSLKGNVVSRISKAPSENKDPNLLPIGKTHSASKSDIEVETRSKNSPFEEMVDKVVTKVLEKYEVRKGSRSFDSTTQDTSVQSVTELVVIDNEVTDNQCEFDSLKDDAVSGMEKMKGESSCGPKFTDAAAEASNYVVNEPLGYDEMDSVKENIITVIPSIASDKNYPRLTDPDTKRDCDGSKDLGDGNAFESEATNELDESYVAECSVPVTAKDTDCVDDKKNGELEGNIGLEGKSDAKDYQDEGYEHNADNFVFSQTGSVDCTFLPESQESVVFGPQKCTNMKKRDGCMNLSGGTDLIKACSCSFCTKAAYIWLDLNYQDIKSRISAIKKSQKEATILVERSCRNKATQNNGPGVSSRVSNVEADLMKHWRSLFQHMADSCANEADHLDAGLLSLTDLREKLKTDLEFINATSLKKH